MNKVELTGRLTVDPTVRRAAKSNGDELAIATFTLAVNRPFARDNDQQKADFIRCKVFGRKADALEKYVRKGQKLDLTGRIETGSYTNKDGQKVYTTEVVVDDWEFGESRKAQGTTDQEPEMYIPEGLENDLPFK